MEVDDADEAIKARGSDTHTACRRRSARRTSPEGEAVARRVRGGRIVVGDGANARLCVALLRSADEQFEAVGRRCPPRRQQDEHSTGSGRRSFLNASPRSRRTFLLPVQQAREQGAPLRLLKLVYGRRGRPCRSPSPAPRRCPSISSMSKVVGRRADGGRPTQVMNASSAAAPVGAPASESPGELRRRRGRLSASALMASPSELPEPGSSDLRPTFPSPCEAGCHCTDSHVVVQPIRALRPRLGDGADGRALRVDPEPWPRVSSSRVGPLVCSSSTGRRWCVT